MGKINKLLHCLLPEKTLFFRSSWFFIISAIVFMYIVTTSCNEITHDCAGIVGYVVQWLLVFETKHQLCSTVRGWFSNCTIITRFTYHRAHSIPEMAKLRFIQSRVARVAMRLFILMILCCKKIWPIFSFGKQENICCLYSWSKLILDE